MGGWLGGWLGGWVGGRTVIIRLNSVQLQLQLPAGTELGNNNDDSIEEVVKMLNEFIRLKTNNNM